MNVFCLQPAKGCKTKPLLINQESSSLASVSSVEKQPHAAIIPALSSQLIFSSIITSTQAKPLGSSAQISLNLTPTTNSTSASKSSPTNTKSSQSSPAKSDTNSSSLVAANALGRPSDSLKSTRQNATSQNNLSSSNGSTPVVSARLIDMGKKLLDAAREGQTEQVRQLVVTSGAPFTSDWLGTTALHLAAQNGHTEIADILLRGGVNRDARTKLERTALHLAAQAGSLEVVDLLINHGSDINARDMLKMTPLHWAVERNHVCVAERLLLGGADFTLKSKFQLTPIDIAQNSQHYEMLEVFKSWNGSEDSLDATIRKLNTSLEESQDMLDFDYHLALIDNATTSHSSSVLDIDTPCIDLVEFEWNKVEFEPDLFLPNDEDDQEEVDEDDEPRVEYLMKIVEELQKENKQLRQKVEQLSTTGQ